MVSPCLTPLFISILLEFSFNINWIFINILDKLWISADESNYLNCLILLRPQMPSKSWCYIRLTFLLEFLLIECGSLSIWLVLWVGRSRISLWVSQLLLSMPSSLAAFPFARPFYTPLIIQSFLNFLVINVSYISSNIQKCVVCDKIRLRCFLITSIPIAWNTSPPIFVIPPGLSSLKQFTSYLV